MCGPLGAPIVGGAVIEQYRQTAMEMQHNMEQQRQARQRELGRLQWLAMNQKPKQKKETTLEVLQRLNDESVARQQGEEDDKPVVKMVGTVGHLRATEYSVFEKEGANGLGKE